MAEKITNSSSSSASATQLPPQPAAVSAISIKIPPFWPADAEVWFAQVETHLATHSMKKQRTRFNHVIAALAPEIATEVRDLFLSPRMTTHTTCSEPS